MLAAAAAACDKGLLDSDRTPVASVVLTPSDSAPLTVGTTLQVTAQARDAAGNALQGRKIVWESDRAEVASVDDQGMVTGNGVGRAQIAANVEGKFGTLTVGVVTRPVVAVAITPDAATVTVGQSLPLTASARDDAGQPVSAPAVWASSDPAIATVNDTGLVTGVASGPVTITATIGGQSGSAAVNVTTAAVGTVDLTPRTATVVTGQSTQLSATVKDVNGRTLTDRPVTWSSSDQNVALVSSTGLVVGVAVGTVTIRAASEGKTASATVNVTAAPAATVDSVVVAPNPATVVVNETRPLTAEPRDSAGNPLPGRTATWTSSDDAIVTVSANGVITGRAAGTATVTATIEGQSGTTTVTVTSVKPKSVNSVTVRPLATTLPVGARQQLQATLRDDDENELRGRSVEWRSSDSTVASVSRTTGLVTARRASPTPVTITATSEGKTGSAVVTVVPAPVTSVEVTPSTASVVAGQQAQLNVTVRDANGATLTGPIPRWTSDSPDVALVSSAGLVVGQAPGTASIVASVDGKADTAVVTVTPAAPPPPTPVAEVVVTPATASVVVGATTQLRAQPQDGAGNGLGGRSITWTSSDQTVATVSNTGLVTGKAPGNATITATSEGKSGTATVTVSPVPPAPVATVTVDPRTANLIVGATQQLTATTKDANGATLTGRPIAWSSSDAAVAEVSATGVVTARAEGAATITATSEDKSGTATINVRPVPLAPVDRVVVTPSSKEMVNGTTFQFTAEPRDAAGNPLTGRAIVWSSAKEDVATVDDDGTVTAVAPGTATIRATSEGKRGQATVTVVPVPAASVTIEPEAPVSLASGTTVDLDAVVRDAAGNVLADRPVTWRSSDTDRATVSNAGVVTGKRAGSVTITAEREGKRDEATITITPGAAASVNGAGPDAGDGQSGEVNSTLPEPLIVLVEDAAGNPVPGVTVVWTATLGGGSLDPSTSVTDADGRAQTRWTLGPETGEQQATASVESVSDTKLFKATATPPPVSSIMVTPGDTTLDALRVTASYAARAFDARGTEIPGATFAWRSSDPDVATVDGAGVVTTVGNGEAVIEATSGGESGSARVIVSQTVVRVDVTPGSATVPAGQTVTFAAVPLDRNDQPVAGRPVTWSTSNGAVATVDQDGTATGVAPGGEARIIATVDGAPPGEAALTVVNEG